jgi:cytochrome P450
MTPDLTTHTREQPAVERHGDGPDDGGRISIADLNVNPYPIYRELREHGVVWVEALGRWMVSRWDDVTSVETAREDFSANETGSNLTRIIGHQMLRSDGAAHKRLRSAAQDPLRPAAIEARAPAFQHIADELLDELAERGEGDLVAGFAAPFAALCLAEVIGLRDVTAYDVEAWSQAIMAGSSNYADDRDVWAIADMAMAQIDRAIDRALDGAPPPGSIIDAMSRSEGAGRPLTLEEIRANVKVIIGGGFNEPRDAVGTALWGLLTHPGQLAAVQADAALWGPVVEEALRWVAPIGVAPREVLRPLQLADTELEPGARVMVNFASANRDERHWDRPDEFDIFRPKTRNVAFGMGHHFCLGVWMSRTQVGAVALPTLLRRLDGLRLDLDRPPTVRGWVFRGPVELHARWKA